MEQVISPIYGMDRKVHLENVLYRTPDNFLVINLRKSHYDPNTGMKVENQNFFDIYASVVVSSVPVQTIDIAATFQTAVTAALAEGML